MKLLVKFPTRGRVDKFLPTFDLYHEMCDDIDNTLFLVSIDEDDETMNNPSVIEKIKGYKNTFLKIGYSKSKIHAVNRDLNEFNENGML